MTKIILLDTDMLLYKFASRNEYVIDWKNEQVLYINKYDETQGHDIFCSLDIACDEFKLFIEDIEEETGYKCEQVFSSSTNFRKDVYPQYKANRTQPKPTLYNGLKDYIMENYPYHCWDGLEADDVLGVIASTEPHKYIISSGDKDLKQIPVEHYDWSKRTFEKVSHDEGDRFFYRQVLTGDSVDNYKGCPGVGPKKADKILDEAEEHFINYWNKCDDNGYATRKTIQQFYIEHIKNKYYENNLTDEYLNNMMVLAKILDKNTYNKKTGWIKKKYINF